MKTIIRSVMGGCFAVAAAAAGAVAPVYTDLTPESQVGVAGSGCAATGTDTACWQAAINASPHQPVFGVVAGQSGKIYSINDTIVICNSAEGVIDGHGAQLKWTGPSDRPMFRVINSNHIRFQNLMIFSENPLHTGIEFFDSGTDSPNTLCTGTRRSSSKNSLDHVTMEGVSLNGLLYGVRFSDPMSVNMNNDMSTIVDSTFYNVTNAAISIEHTNSHQHRFISVNGTGAPGNNGCFVNAQSGFFSSTGGYQKGWGNANFCINGTNGTFDIIESNSEYSKRMVKAGEADQVTGYPVSLNVRGGRFAVNDMASDGKVIDFNRLGPMTVSGLRIDGTPPAGVQPHISMLPGTPGLGWKAKAFIDDVVFYVTNSSTWDAVVSRSFIDMFVVNAVCMDATDHSVNCSSTTPLAVP